MKKWDMDGLKCKAVDAAEGEEARQALEDLFFGDEPLTTPEELREVRRKEVSAILPLAECRDEESVQACEDEFLKAALSHAKTLAELNSVSVVFAFLGDCQKISERYADERKCFTTPGDYLYCFCDERETPNEG